MYKQEISSRDEFIFQLLILGSMKIVANPDWIAANRHNQAVKHKWSGQFDDNVTYSRDSKVIF